MPRLPVKIVEDLCATKSIALPVIYRQACQFVCDLDDADLLNDQIFSCVDEEGLIGIEWPNYGLSFDIYLTKYVCNSTKDGIYAHLFSYESAIALMIMFLKKYVDKNDECRNRSLENTEWVSVPF